VTSPAVRNPRQSLSNDSVHDLAGQPQGPRVTARELGPGTASGSRVLPLALLGHQGSRLVREVVMDALDDRFC
jgi:hypothetical protein